MPVPHERSTRRESDDYSDVVALIQQMQALDENSPQRRVLRDRIITRCLPLAEHIARRFGGRGEAHEDLLQVSRLGLVNAVDRFDIERGSDFVSFAVPTIMGEARRYFRDAGWSVRVPRRMKELNSMISQAVGSLSQKLGRAPTASEIAVELGIDVKEASQALLARSAYQTVSVDSVVSEDRLPLMDTLGAEDPELEKMESYLAVRPALEKLPERERRIVVLRFFGSMTQTQIAEKVGISQMHVSRILARTLAQLREDLGED
ncbi:RNA polymerase sigma factor SigB [Rhodococcus sp. B7740]|uniref:SigB/SigF/SigG family RNA polymerase sigma factor n=1 Tax=Rhodococcus sp. B7740 TaxID=1564114 RepID=UPI0005DA05DF|nr:RNA polymerase sigma factor SigB [Rhodococcus sp. B7740]